MNSIADGLWKLNIISSVSVPLLQMFNLQKVTFMGIIEHDHKTKTKLNSMVWVRSA
jgi:hypothetical protein